MARFALNPDYRDFLSECNAQNVEYLVIGGQAVIFYGYVRKRCACPFYPIGRSAPE
jgi:hypothetical protein